MSIVQNRSNGKSDPSSIASDHVRNEVSGRPLFGQIPYSIFDDTTVSPWGHRVFDQLVRHCGNKTFCYPSHARLAEKLKCSVTTVRRHLEELEEAGWIRSEHQRLANRYHITHPDWLRVNKHCLDDRSWVTDHLPVNINDCSLENNHRPVTDHGCSLENNHGCSLENTKEYTRQEHTASKEEELTITQKQRDTTTTDSHIDSGNQEQPKKAVVVVPSSSNHSDNYLQDQGQTNQSLVARMRELGIPRMRAQQLAAAHDKTRITGWLEHIDFVAREAPQTLENPAGFLISMLERGNVAPAPKSGRNGHDKDYSGGRFAELIVS